MLETIERSIEKEAKKRIKKYRAELVRSKYSRTRYRKRTGIPGAVSSRKKPKLWDIDKHFDPKYCIKHSKFLAKGIWNSIQKDKYSPRPAVEFEFDKPNGGKRNIHIFSIPDAAVSNAFAYRLIKRNEKSFSASSFAYRHDKTPLDAIIHIKRLISDEKTFVVSYDFSKYFDNITKEHLTTSVLSKNNDMLTTHAERAVIRGFLKHRFAKPTDYKLGNFEFANKGVPQGTSISLFLANIAAHELDTSLDRINGGFARFADDTIIVTQSYEDAIRTQDIFYNFAGNSGISINEDKSIGIRLLSDKDAEIKSCQSIQFLGYSIGKRKTSLSDRSVSSIKRRISKTIYNHLLYYPRKVGHFNSSRVGPGFFDWDLVTCINDIRRFIYGTVREKVIRDNLNKKTTFKKFRGVMSYYCLVDDIKQLTELDGWLVDVIHRAYKERCKLLSTSYGISQPSLTSSDILSGSWYAYPAIGKQIETQCPSFVVSWRTARKYWSRKGIAGVEIPKDVYTYF